MTDNNNELPVRRPQGGSAPDTNPAGISQPLTAAQLPEGLDLDRLRSSTESVIAAKTDEMGAVDLLNTNSPSHGDTHNRTPAWLKVGLPIGVAAMLATAGISMSGGDSTDTADGQPTTESVAASGFPTTAVQTTGVPTTAVPTTAVPTTAVPTTAVPATAAPTTAAPTTAAPTTTPVASAPTTPPHTATYRGGKLYLEGSVRDQAEAQKYIDKAAGVLGIDNVVNNYKFDPSVPASADGTVYVDEPFLFASGSSTLDPDYYGVLNLGVAALNLSPNARMIVTGYTDSKGDPAKNVQLSQARADAVVHYMVTVGGVPADRLKSVGAGDSDPVGDNATAQGRALNRRIDVKLVDLLS